MLAGTGNAPSYSSPSSESKTWRPSRYATSSYAQRTAFWRARAARMAKSAPSKAFLTPLPLLLWHHGGGFIAGATSEPRQDAGNLSKKGGMVVTLNYRLGIFGVFSHP